MSNKTILVTKHLRDIVNEFMGLEFIPECAIGKEMAFMDGSLIMKTFSKGLMKGYRSLNADGEVTNVITELFPK